MVGAVGEDVDGLLCLVLLHEDAAADIVQFRRVSALSLVDADPAFGLLEGAHFAVDKSHVVGGLLCAVHLGFLEVLEGQVVLAIHQIDFSEGE